MKILFYRYGSIVEHHLIDCFKSYGIEVIEDLRHIKEGKVSSKQIMDDISSYLDKNTFLFVFSINFFPDVSNICNLYNVTYVSWTVDSPFIQLFSPALHNKCNKIFFFDMAQYERFGTALGEDHGFYLPLAGNPARFTTTINSADSRRLESFSSDISMVGSLYNEKNPYRSIPNMSDYLKGYVDALEQAQMSIYGDNIIESALSDRAMSEFEALVPDIQSADMSSDEKKYKVAHFLIGPDLAYRERVDILNMLAVSHKVDLYTQSDISTLKGVHMAGSANTFTEMPLIFNQSKINLNITMRPIITGLSQRIYDVLACKGFLITNYQQELEDLFEIGRDLECYSSKEELLDKTDYYLRHDSEREQIALNGFEKLRQQHTFEHRFKEMLSKILNSSN